MNIVIPDAIKIAIYFPVANGETTANALEK